MQQTQESLKIILNGSLVDLSTCSYDELRKENNSGWWTDIVDFLERFVSIESHIELQTSGSTGEPKRFLVEKFKLFNSAHKTVEFFNLNSESTSLLCMSAKYIAGQMMLVRAIVSGMNLICVEPTSNPVCELNCDIDFAAMVPMQVQESVKYIDGFNKINNLIIGGGQVEDLLVEQLKTTNVTAYETFGMTETLSHIALRKLTPKTDDRFQVLHGVSVLKGYDDRLIIDSPDIGVYKMKTNDIVEVMPNGSFEWLGRTDFAVNSGGVKVLPEVVERQLLGVIAQSFCISSVSDERLGERVVLVLEGKELLDKDILANVNGLLEKYHQPKEVFLLAEFPRTPNGKIKRLEIKKAICL